MKKVHSLALLSGFISFGCYLYSLAPSVSFGDSGELVSAAYTLGIAHPPGYPLWVLLAKSFTFLPLGSIAYRVNLMSALFASLSVALLFLLSASFMPQRAWAVEAAFMSSLFLAFSPIFWSQAIIAEVYSLNCFFLALCLYLAFLWAMRSEQGEGKRGLLLLLAFSLGLGATNHQSLLLTLPAFLYLLVAFGERPSAFSWRRLFQNLTLFALFFLIGLSLYGFIPIRALMLPPVNWGCPDTLQSFWHHLSRGQYRSVFYPDRPLRMTLYQGAFFLKTLKGQFEPLFWLLPLPLLFMRGLRKGENRWLLFTLLVFFFTGIFFILMVNAELSLGQQPILRIYFLPAIMVYSLWMGWGLSKGLGWLRERLSRSFPTWVLTCALILLPLVPLFKNYSSTSQRGNEWPYKFALELAEKIGSSRAVLLSGTDASHFLPMYMKHCDGELQGLTMVAINRLSDRYYQRELRFTTSLVLLGDRDYIQAFGRRPERGGPKEASTLKNLIKVNSYVLGRLRDLNHDKGPFYYMEGYAMPWLYDYLRPEGLLMKVEREKVKELDGAIVGREEGYWGEKKQTLLKDEHFINDMSARQAYSKARGNLGRLYQHHGMTELAERAYKDAIELSAINADAYLDLAKLYLRQGRPQEALDAFAPYAYQDTYSPEVQSFLKSLQEAADKGGEETFLKKGFLLLPPLLPKTF